MRNRWAWLREADSSVRDSGSVAGKSDNAEPISSGSDPANQPDWIAISAGNGAVNDA
ncbi:hypothetical protein [Lacipirellula sp.]|uniref:hypothetical protein n=1 Tax=Lacipirellula sp. TaxID=2691419 RepID=UPI003D13F5CB